MWEVKTIIVDNDVHQISLLENSVPLRYEDVIRYWHENYEFRDFYVSILKEAPFDAFFWENPPLTKSNLRQTYEFVLVYSPQLANVRADSKAFSQQFHSQDDSRSVIRFQNIGRNAELVVPRPLTTESIYSHFAIFLRNAPPAQVHELFIVLADSLKEKISDKPIWLSTSGLGVYWLHVRIDKRPKYYTYQPYKQYS
jgi:hypothetical protein